MNRKQQIYKLIKESSLFDPIYYQSNYQDILPKNCDPLAHFMRIGWKKGLNPSLDFDVNAYLRTYPDVKDANVNPLVHYLQNGQQEGRSKFQVTQKSNDVDRGTNKSNANNHVDEELKLDNLLPLIDGLQTSKIDADHVKGLIDDYYDLYFRSIKFKQKPLIKIADYFDRRLINKQGIQRFLFNSLHFFSVVKNQGLSAYIKERREHNRKIKIKKTISTASTITPLPRDLPILLIKKVFESCLRHFANHPPLTYDLFMFSSTDWEDSPVHTRKLVDGFVDGGHRVFFIEPEISHFTDPEIVWKGGGVYLLKLPRELNEDDSPVFTLSNDDAAYLKSVLKKVKHAFSVSSCLALSDNPFWCKLLLQLRRDFGWKIICDQANEQTGKGNDTVFAVADAQRLVKECDLIIASSKQTVKREPGGSILLVGENKNAAEIISAFEALFPKISVVIVTYNNLELTRLCLDSIHDNTEYPNYEIVVVDNASSDDTVAYLEEYIKDHANVVFIKSENNLGFAGGNNLGVKAAGGDYVVLLNNDTIVTPGWLHNLLLHLQQDVNVGMVGPVTNTIGNEAKINIDYTDLADVNHFAAVRAEKFYGVSFPIKVLALYCCMMPRELYLRLDGLDERFHVGMFEDDDMAMKLEKEGLQLLCAEDVFIHHFHGASFNKIENQELHRIFQENKLKFEVKWGVVWQPHQNRKK